ncbi:MAG: protein translocase subunit SecD [Deltaproteobacteria bacterium]|jgi:preprotein translocase subunit SecD|nr:protein translocase subunit SecD [Deltaproteobacteria bacterium]
MERNLTARGLILALVILGGLAFFLPTLYRLGSVDGRLPAFWESYLPSKSINLGLDLKGGIYLVMEIDLQAALLANIHMRAEELRRELAEAELTGLQINTGDSLEFSLSASDPEKLNKAEELIKKQFQNLRIVARAAQSLTLTMTNDEADYLKELTARQALETIRNRVDLFGVAEPDIRPQGQDRVVIQLPGLSNPQEAVALIGKTAVLEFKLVDNGPVTVEQALRVGPPPGTIILYEKRLDPVTQKEERIPHLLQRQTLLTGNSLVDARVRRGDLGEIQVSMTFDSRGAREFEEITGRYVNRQLAIVLDDQVYSAPLIRSRIPGGEAVIDGSFTQEEGQVLAVALRAGALPAPVRVLEERSVGPSLGQDSIKQGLTAGLVGLGAILLFMVIYYSWAGLVADLALILNFPIILGALAGFGATLTLPGIFGLVLTMAMAVDANVLIFERIREEIRLGKSPVAAVNGGFNRAFWTIFDSNLTTIIAALVLYQFGSGPIRGFAVTLIIGILSSMFTAIFASRFVFDLVLKNKRVKRISI